MASYRETHDELTGLPNRRGIDELAHALALDAKSDLVLVLIELQSSGQDLRRTVAQRLRACARGDDVVAHLDDGRFAVLLTPRIDADDEDRLLARLRTALGADLPDTDPTLGVAHCPEDGTRLEQLLACASRRLRGVAAAH